MHKVCSSQLLPLPTDIEETHEALNAVQVCTISTEQFLLLMIRKKTIVTFSCKTSLEFSSSVDGLMVDGIFKSTPKFFYKPFTIHGFCSCHYKPLVYFLLANKHQTSYEDVFRHTVLEAAQLRMNDCLTVV
jgi:hypothetical protein